MGIHDVGDLKSILDTLARMEELEQTVSEFYKQCAETWPTNFPFWMELSNEELKHEKNVAAMYRIVLDKPERFEKGRHSIFSPHKQS